MSSTSYALPCRTTAETMYSGMLEASGAEVFEWLRSPSFESKLFSFFPCTDILPTSANKVCCDQALPDSSASEGPVLISYPRCPSPKSRQLNNLASESL